MSGTNIGDKNSRRAMRDACVYGGFQEADKLYFRDSAIYIQSDTDGYINIVADTGIKLNGSLLSATGAEITRAADTSARIVSTTASVLALTVTEHAERVVIINSNTTFNNTFTLPVAAGTGEKFTLINNLVQTQGTVVISANGTTDVLTGVAVVVSSTEEAAGSFLTSATSDKISLNLTTTGGLKGDMVEAWDILANTWAVKVLCVGSGTLATPFSAT